MRPQRWKFRTDPNDEGRAGHWFDPEVAETGWNRISVTRSWEE